METMTFKTNLRCSGCVEKITPALDELAGKNQWSVDLKDSCKTLTVSAEDVTEQNIQSAVEKAGYKLQKL